MRSGVLVVTVVCSTMSILAQQNQLPALGQTVVVATRSVRQATTQAPYEVTFESGTRVTIAKQDVHDLATHIVRVEARKQASFQKDSGNIIVLHIRERTPTSQTHVDVTLFSGAVVRIPSGDISDPRLAFLRTALAEAIGEDKARAPISSLKSGNEAPTSGDSVQVIRAKCAKDWPDDFRMRAYCQEQQEAGIAALSARTMTSNVDHRTIRSKCATDWPDDFRMRNYCEEQQLEALKRIR